MSWFLVYSATGWLIAIAMVLVVLRRQFAPGAAWAWLGIVFLHPYIGFTLYLLVGENRLSPRRTAEHLRIVSQYRPRPAAPDSPAAACLAALPAFYRPMALQAEKISGLPLCAGNTVEFLPTSAQMTDRLAADIDGAKSHVHLLYYMFAADGTGRKIADAMIRAAGRGVQCRVLVDAVASRSFFRESGLGPRLAAANVKIAAALPVAPLRRGFSRMDMRNHRKLAVIDDVFAFAGSHNLVDPSYGGRRGNPWVDVTARSLGPVVYDLASIFCEDWAFETGEKLQPRRIVQAESAAAMDAVAMQVVPTGPSAPGQTYRRLLLGAIQCACRQLILTTPYFVPDEPLVVSLLMAADRGVDVKLIVPRNADSILTAAAGRAHFARLMNAGVEVHLYRPGLLHSKTTSVDDAFVVFGSANLDVRSFNLNFELSTVMYGAAVTRKLREIQTGYLADSTRLEEEDWSGRPAVRRYADGVISLISPLL